MRSLLLAALLVLFALVAVQAATPRSQALQQILSFLQDSGKTKSDDEKLAYLTQSLSTIGSAKTLSQPKKDHAKPVYTVPKTHDGRYVDYQDSSSSSSAKTMAAARAGAASGFINGDTIAEDPVNIPVNKVTGGQNSGSGNPNGNNGNNGNGNGNGPVTGGSGGIRN